MPDGESPSRPVRRLLTHHGCGPDTVCPLFPGNHGRKRIWPWSGRTRLELGASPAWRPSCAASRDRPAKSWPDRTGGRPGPTGDAIVPRLSNLRPDRVYLPLCIPMPTWSGSIYGQGPDRAPDGADLAGSVDMGSAHGDQRIQFRPPCSDVLATCPDWGRREKGRGLRKTRGPRWTAYPRSCAQSRCRGIRGRGHRVRVPGGFAEATDEYARGLFLFLLSGRGLARPWRIGRGSCPGDAPAREEGELSRKWPRLPGASRLRPGEATETNRVRLGEPLVLYNDMLGDDMWRSGDAATVSCGAPTKPCGCWTITWRGHA
jgi:hypothetical protein